MNNVRKVLISIKEMRDEHRFKNYVLRARKDGHRAGVKDHTDSKLAHGNMVGEIYGKIGMAEKMEEVLVLEAAASKAAAASRYVGGGSRRSEDNAALNDLVTYEAAVAEENQVATCAPGVVRDLRLELEVLDQRVPELEQAKKTAATLSLNQYDSDDISRLLHDDDPGKSPHNNSEWTVDTEKDDEDDKEDENHNLELRPSVGGRAT